MSRYARNSGGASGSKHAVMWDEKHSKVYNMTHPKRGVALIFYHENFHPNLNLGLHSRDGTTDKKILTKTFEKLGFAVQIHTDLSLEKLKARARELRDEDHSDHDCLVVVVVSHGDGKEVYAYDESYEPEKLCKMFTAENCETLAGKPKIFLFEGPRPRGAKFMDGVERNCSDSRSDYRAPTDADFLIVYGSTVQGCSLDGSASWFIQAFCNVMEEEDVENEDLMSMMTLVNRKVEIDFEINAKDNPSTHLKKQMPLILSTLTRDVYFRSKGHWLSP